MHLSDTAISTLDYFIHTKKIVLMVFNLITCHGSRKNFTQTLISLLLQEPSDATSLHTGLRATVFPCYRATVSILWYLSWSATVWSFCDFHGPEFCLRILYDFNAILKEIGGHVFCIVVRSGGQKLCQLQLISFGYFQVLTISGNAKFFLKMELYWTKKNLYNKATAS